MARDGFFARLAAALNVRGTEPTGRNEGDDNCIDGGAGPLGPAGSARAATGIIDEVKLGILDHDVAIGGDHKECCVDHISDANLTPHNPGFSNVGVCFGYRL